jgi:hypothetical protein
MEDVENLDENLGIILNYVFVEVDNLDVDLKGYFIYFS